MTSPPTGRSDAGTSASHLESGTSAFHLGADDPPSNLVMTGFYTFSPAIFHACHLTQPSNRGEYEVSGAIDLLIQSGRTIDAIGLDGWRIDVGYPEDRDEAEQRLNDAETAASKVESSATGDD